MIEPLACPECTSMNTGRVDMVNDGEEYVETYICEDCPTQYTVKYEAYEKEVDKI